MHLAYKMATSISKSRTSIFVFLLFVGKVGMGVGQVVASEQCG
jgi:hypothetical protein